MRTLNQLYAEKALEYIKKIEEVSQNNEKLKNEYTSRAKKLPAMITHNGLLVTLAFLYSKAEFKNGNPTNAEAYLLEHIVDAINDQNDKAINNDEQGKGEEKNKDKYKDFIRFLTNTKIYELMFFTKKALLFSQMLKKLVEGAFGEKSRD